MLARSSLTLSSLLALGIAATAACGTAPEGVVGVEGAGEVSPAGGKPCPTCVLTGPPFTSETGWSINVGNVAAEHDPQNGYRFATAVVVAPSTGNVTMSIPNLSNEWQLNGAYNERVGGSSASYVSNNTYTMPVLAGDYIQISMTFRPSSADLLGAQTTSLQLEEFTATPPASLAAITLTANTTLYPPNTPVFTYSQQTVCGNYAPTGDPQLGNVSSPCTGSASTGMNEARIVVTAKNVGTGPGTVAFNQSQDTAVLTNEHLSDSCSPAPPSTIAAGATYTTTCTLRAIATAPGGGFVPALQVAAPITLYGGASPQMTLFDSVDILATPPAGPPCGAQGQPACSGGACGSGLVDNGGTCTCAQIGQKGTCCSGLEPNENNGNVCATADPAGCGVTAIGDAPPCCKNKSPMCSGSGTCVTDSSATPPYQFCCSTANGAICP